MSDLRGKGRLGGGVKWADVGGRTKRVGGSGKGGNGGGQY